MMEQRFRDSVWGLIWGDVVGSYFEFKPPMKGNVNIKKLYGKRNVFGYPFGFYTDDTALTLAGMASFIKRGFYDDEDQFQVALNYMRQGYMSSDPGVCFDIGSTTAINLNARADGDAAHDHYPGTGAGNGVLMRLAPYAYWSACNVPETKKNLYYESVCRLTHNTNEARWTTRYFGKVLEDIYTNQVPAPFHSGVATDMKGSGFCVDSLNIALECAHYNRSLEGSIKDAIRFGYDTDTNAAIAGQMTGALYGADCVDKTRIRNHQAIDDMINKFITITQDASNETFNRIHQR